MLEQLPSAAHAPRMVDGKDLCLCPVKPLESEFSFFPKDTYKYMYSLYKESVSTRKFSSAKVIGMDLHATATQEWVVSALLWELLLTCEYVVWLLHAPFASVYKM